MVDVLVLVRHGKSDWSEALPDRQRPLAERGRRQAPRSGAWLATHGPAIDLAVVSPAVRAGQTWALVANAYDMAPRAVIDERVYGAEADNLLSLLRDPAYADVGCLAVVGHEPALGDLATTLVGRTVEMPTSAVAVIEIADGRRRLVASGRPPADPDRVLDGPS